MRMQTENKNWYWENTHGSRLTGRGSRSDFKGYLPVTRPAHSTPAVSVSCGQCLQWGYRTLGTADLSQQAGQRDGLTLRISSTSLWSWHSHVVWSISITSVSTCRQPVCKGSGKQSRRWGAYRGEAESKDEREGNERWIKYKTIEFFWSTLNPDIMVHPEIQSCSHMLLCMNKCRELIHVA